MDSETNPNQQEATMNYDGYREEMEAEFNARYDDVRERFAGEALDPRVEGYYDLDAEERGEGDCCNYHGNGGALSRECGRDFISDEPAPWERIEGLAILHPQDEVDF